MSPVHDQSYRRYEGTRMPRGRAWWVILRTGTVSFLSRKIFLALLVAAWLPFLVRAVQIYAVVTYPDAAAVLPVDGRLFQSFVEVQGTFAFFVTVFVGAGLIANDRRAHALPVYLAKPISRVEYVAGKFGILTVFLSLVTLAPALLLLIVQAALSGGLDLVTGEPRVIPAVVVASMLRIVVPALTILALSSLSTSARFVALLYTGVVFFSEALYAVLAFATGSTRVAWISVTRNFEMLTDLCFGATPRYELPALVAVIVVVGIVTLSVSILERRVRGVEVVS